MRETCEYCGAEYTHGGGANIICFCPQCGKRNRIECEYGYGPVVPCTIYCGDSAVAEIGADYILRSSRCGLRIPLKGRRKDLAAYTEAEEILIPYLPKNGY